MIDLPDILTIDEMNDEDRALEAEIIIVGELMLSDDDQPPTCPAPDDFQCQFHAAVAYAAIALRLSNQRPTPSSIWAIVKFRTDAGDFEQDQIEGLRSRAKNATRDEMIEAGLFLASRMAQKNIEQARVLTSPPTLN